MKTSFYLNAKLVVPAIVRVPAPQPEVVTRGQARSEFSVFFTAQVELASRVNATSDISVAKTHAIDVSTRVVARTSITGSASVRLDVSGRAQAIATGAQFDSADVAYAYNAETLAATQLLWGVKSGVTVGGRTYVVHDGTISEVVEGNSAAFITTPPVRFGRPVAVGDVYTDMSGLNTELHVEADTGSVGYRLPTDKTMSAYRCRTGALRVTRAKLRFVCGDFVSLESTTLYPVTMTRGGKPE